MNRYLLIDGSNITHAANGSKKLTVGDTEVQAIFGFMRTLRKLVATYPGATPIVLWDGASWRHMEYPEYKANRTKNDTKSDAKQQEARKAAQTQMPAIKKGLQLLGVSQVRASNMEADDLAAILGDRYESRGDKIVLVSGDKDWVQLVKPNMIWFDPINDRRIRSAADIEGAIGYQVESFQQFLELKCIMGDTGDNIGGVGGIGEKGAQEFLSQYGSVANFSNAILDGSIDPKKLPKKLRDFAESEEKRMIFNRNLRLMDLRTPVRPAPVNLQIDRGTPDEERFRAYCNKLMFRSISKELTSWLSVFPAFTHLQEELAA